MVLLILLLAFCAAVILGLGIRQFAMIADDRAMAVSTATPQEEQDESALANWNRRFSRTRVGRWLAEELELADIRVPPLAASAVMVLSMALAGYLVYRLLAPLLAVLGVLLILFTGKVFLERGQRRRTEKFVGQLPELARVMANASNAGLSLPTALARAGREMTAPASVELERVSTQLRFGSSLERGLASLRRRIPSREVGILVATLVVAARSGGSTVTALRTIAEALEQRKETRREIESTLAQATATANMIAFMGVGVLIVLNVLYPGTVDKMTRSLIGQGALLISGLMMVTGILVIRQMTKVDR